MKLTIKAAVLMYQGIEGLLKSPSLNKKLIYALLKTKAILKPTFDAVAEMEKPGEDYSLFDKERQALVKAHSDSKGVIADPVKLQADFDALKETHKAALDGYMESLKPVQEHLKTEEDFPLHFASFETLPEDISPAVMEAIDPMIYAPKDEPPPEGKPDAPKPE